MASPDYFTIQDREYHSVRQLIARGWSLELIAAELGAPDLLQDTTAGLRRCYRRDRVKAAEVNSLQVAHALAAYWLTQVESAAAKVKRHLARAEYLDFWKRNQKLMHEVEELIEEQDHD